MSSDEQRIREYFRQLDTDGNGILSYDELKEMFRSADFSEDNLNTLCKAADANGDGVISYDEFVDFLFSKQSHAIKSYQVDAGRQDILQMTPAAIAELAGKYDEDKDGLLNEKELKNYIKAELGFVPDNYYFQCLFKGQLAKSFGYESAKAVPLVAAEPNKDHSIHWLTKTRLIPLSALWAAKEANPRSWDAWIFLFWDPGAAAHRFSYKKLMLLMTTLKTKCRDVGALGGKYRQDMILEVMKTIDDYQSYLQQSSNWKVDNDLAWTHALVSCLEEVVDVEWPSPNSMPAPPQPDNHLEMGVTAKGFVAVMTKMDLWEQDKFYKRHWKQGKQCDDVAKQRRAELGIEWVNNVSEKHACGYDLQKKISRTVKAQGLQEYSMVEIMIAQKHPGAGMANRFFSHAQMEKLSVTLEAMQRYDINEGKPHIFFLDYPSLRQATKDFNLAEVEKAIGKINHTVMLLEPADNPETLKRIFCIFEVSCTVRSETTFSTIIPPTSSLKPFIDAMTKDATSMIEKLEGVDVQNAQSRNPDDKVKILEELERGFGIKEANEATAVAVVGGVLPQVLKELDGRRQTQQKLEIIEFLKLAKHFIPKLPKSAQKVLLDALDKEKNDIFQVAVYHEDLEIVKMCLNVARSAGSLTHMLEKRMQKFSTWNQFDRLSNGREATKSSTPFDWSFEEQLLDLFLAALKETNLCPGVTWVKFQALDGLKPYIIIDEAEVARRLADRIKKLTTSGQKEFLGRMPESEKQMLEKYGHKV